MSYKRVEVVAGGMEDLVVTSRRHETVIEPPPGYMRSTLSTPGPCARPFTSRRPVSAPAFTFISLPAHPGRPTSMTSSGPKGHKARNTRSVGIAGFYDWSPGLTIQQCAQRGETAGRVESQSSKAVTQSGNAVKGGRVKQWWGPGLRNYTGRMFVKEKGFLTKGEQEIITGIVQNRGDRLEGEPDQREAVHSHQDAWVVAPASSRQCYSADPRSPLRQEALGHLEEACVECAGQFHQNAHLVGDYCVRCLEKRRDRSGGTEPIAPPSTPEEVRRNKSRRAARVPPIVSDQGAVYVRKVQINAPYSLEPLPRSGLGQRTVMDVYLPRLPNVSAAHDTDGDRDNSGADYGDDSSEYEMAPDEQLVIDGKFPLRMTPGAFSRAGGGGGGGGRQRTFPPPKMLPSPRYHTEPVPDPRSAALTVSAHIRHSNRLTSRSQKT